VSYSKEALENSSDMAPVHGRVEIDVPVDVLWECFTHANWWSRWNRCMFWARNRDLVLGEQLVWAFEPLRWIYLYRLPGIAKLVEVEENSHVTWEVTAVPGFYARHTYFIEDLGEDRSRFGSWEQAMGPTFRLLKRFWLAHFVFVRDRSVQGARLLESIYRQQGRIDNQTIRKRPPLRPVREVLRSTTLLRMEHNELAPGVHALLHAGGNSLVVHDGGEVLLVDTKMPPFAGRLRNWIKRHTGTPVTTIVNTHFHYDHTQGNRLYPQARIFAHRSAPELMQLRDPGIWKKQAAGIPTADNLIDNNLTLLIGDQKVNIHHSGRGHTATDLWLHLHCNGQDIIATGDVASLDIYPFFDTGTGGADILNMIRLLREWARNYPKAIFMPGHGRVARATDLLTHANYLEFLYDSVAAAIAAGMSEEETILNIDLVYFDLFIVPIYHYGWSVLGARSNVQSVYRLQQKSQ
jgi:glyoxylase-like metal-dependent hydrolase (beta-lactamase superfamily II)